MSNKQLSFNEICEQDKDKKMAKDLAYEVFSKIIFETKKKEGDITGWATKWLKKPKNKTAYDCFAKATKILDEGKSDTKKIKSATLDGNTHKWDYKDPRVVANELLEAARMKERVITLSEREEMKAECPKEKQKQLDKLLSETVLKDDLKGISKGQDGKWHIDFDDKDLKQEMSKNKKNAVETYSM